MYNDLLMIDGDLVIDGQGNPIFFNGVQVLEQSLRNRIAELNFLYLLIGERNPTNRLAVYARVKSSVESDVRIVPGSCSLVENEIEQIVVTAKTENGEDIRLVYDIRYEIDLPHTEAPTVTEPEPPYIPQGELFTLAGVRVVASQNFDTQFILNGVFVN